MSSHEGVCEESSPHIHYVREDIGPHMHGVREESSPIIHRASEGTHQHICWWARRADSLHITYVTQLNMMRGGGPVAKQATQQQYA